MEITNLRARPLSEDELLLRQAYQQGPHTLWQSPMNYFAYEGLLKEELVIETPSFHLFKDTSKDLLGVTVDEIPLQDQAYATVHPRYSYPLLHNHNYIEMVYVAAGQCINFFDRTSVPMKTGDVCMIAPSSQHALSCTDDESCIINLMVNRRFFDHRFLRILRGGKLLASYLEEILLEQEVSPYILFPTGEDPWLQDLSRRILSEITEHEYGYEYSITLLIGQFLLQLVREYEQSAIVPGRSNHKQNDMIVGVLNYLSIHYSCTSLKETAQYFGYSSAYLSRLLHEKTGKTFQHIITQIQVERAAQLMDSGQKNLTEIAQEVGCFDTSHLYKKFKAAYGISPQQYLKTKGSQGTLK